MYVTQMYDNGHTGWNPNETLLTVQNVKAGIKVLFSQALDAQVYAQPLFLPGLTIPGKGTHNVVFMAIYPKRHYLRI